MSYIIREPIQREEYVIKKILRIGDGIPLFLFTFSKFLTKFLSTLLKHVKSVNSSGIDFIIEDRGGLLNCSIPNFLPENKLKFVAFSSKMRPNTLFQPTFFKIA